MADTIEMSFEEQAHMGPRNHELNGGTLAPPGKCDGLICAAAAMLSVAIITVTTCYYYFYYHQKKLTKS